MKNFFLSTLSSILKTIIVFAALSYLSLCLYLGKFPIGLSAVKEQINQLVQAREKYAKLLDKSEDYLKKQQPGEISNKFTETPSEARPAAIDNINMQILLIKSQLNRIEEQNSLIIKSIKK